MDLEYIGGAIVAVLIVFALLRQVGENLTRDCPQCGQRVKSKAKMCPYCGLNLMAR